jgi:ribosome-associated protein
MDSVQAGSTDGEAANGNSPIEFARQAAQLAMDLHCEEVRLLDVRGLSQICDFILVASGTSDRQMRSVADDMERLAEESGYQRFRVTGDSLDTWIVVDFVDLVVHLFEPGRRRYYDIENLWSDSVDIEFQRSDSGQ